MESNVTNEIENTLNSNKPYLTAKIKLTMAVTREAFTDYLGDTLQKSLESCGVDCSWLSTVNLAVYDEASEERLVGLKSEIQALFNETLSSMQRPYQAVDKLNKQYVAIRDAKNPNKALQAERLAALTEKIEALQAEAKSFVPAFMNARRAEEYFRTIPTAYREQSTEAFFVSYRFLLRTNLWNPSTDTLNEAIAQFS